MGGIRLTVVFRNSFGDEFRRCVGGPALCTPIIPSEINSAAANAVWRRSRNRVAGGWKVEWSQSSQSA
jgi:hypothetical protein